MMATPYTGSYFKFEESKTKPNYMKRLYEECNIWRWSYLKQFLKEEDFEEIWED